MKILSIKPESLIEWPGHLSYVIFLAGCNFRCGFCYVPDLILPLRYKNKKEISIKEILEDIKQRTESGWIDAICITGGEPTLNSHLPNFL
jgi:pyruvate formate lyase activating enzyme